MLDDSLKKLKIDAGDKGNETQTAKGYLKNDLIKAYLQNVLAGFLSQSEVWI